MRGLAPGALALLAACHASTVVVGELQEITSLKANPNRKLDILFVVDNSASMATKQASLAANFPRMIDVLEQLDGGLPDIHIGVVTSDLGTLGANSPTPAPPVGVIGAGGCSGRGDDGALQAGSAAMTDAYISDIAGPDGTRVRNYSGELRDVFSEIALVGEQGCGFEQHLAATRRALTHPANAGFLRPDANLALVIIADEDDCSVLDPAFFAPANATLGPQQSFRCTRQGVVCDPDDLSPGDRTDCAPRADSLLVEDVQPFVEALVEAKGDPRKVMVSAIAGDPTRVSIVYRDDGSGMVTPTLAASCAFGPQGQQTADPPVRLAAFLDAFPGRSQLASICSDDLSVALGTIGDSAKKLVGDPCLDSARLADASPDPGLQPACAVIDVRDSSPGTPRDLPACQPGATDCFEILPDAAACPAAPEHLRVRFRRGSVVTDDTWTHVRCQLRS